MPIHLARIYDVSDKTMRKWIKLIQAKVGKLNGYYYEADQVRIIFGLIDLPFNVKLIDMERKALECKTSGNKRYAKVHNIGKFGKEVERHFAYSD